MVAVHASLALAVEGAVHLEAGASLNHGSSTGPDGTAFLTWKQKG